MLSVVQKKKHVYVFSLAEVTEKKSALPGEDAGFYFSAFYGPDLRLWADGHTHLIDRAIILGEGVHSPADCRLYIKQPASEPLRAL